MLLKHVGDDEFDWNILYGQIYTYSCVIFHSHCWGCINHIHSTLWQTHLHMTFAYTHEVPSRFTTQYPTKKTLQLISTFSPLVTAQHTTCSNTHLVLLKKGIMVPETCWESIDNKHLTVASCWFSLSLHNLRTMRSHRNLKPKTIHSVCMCF